MAPRTYSTRNDRERMTFAATLAFAGLLSGCALALPDEGSVELPRDPVVTTVGRRTIRVSIYAVPGSSASQDSWNITVSR